MKFLFALLLPFHLFSQEKIKILKQEMVFANPPFASAHASTITELSNGNMMAAWFGGPDEGDPTVCIWTSTLSGDKWSQPALAANGKEANDKQYACWNPVLFLDASKKLFLYYKAGPSPSEWWGMVKTSNDNGQTWSAAKRLPQGLLGPIKDKPVQLKNGEILYPSSNEVTGTRVWTIHLEISDKNSDNWKKILINCDTFNVIQPTILIHLENRLQMLCRSRQRAIVQTWSNDNGRTWSPLTKLNITNPNSGIDALTTKTGQHVLVYNPYPGRGILRIAVSKNGIDWTDVYELENRTGGEFSYPAIIQSSDGKLHITYTHERKNIRHVVVEM
jgi:alpha-L-fucosidase